MHKIEASLSVMLVRDIMTNPVQTILLDDFIFKAKQLFDRKRFHHVVVLERDRVFGVVSDRDILRVISPFVGKPMMERKQDLRTLKGRIHQIMSRGLITIGPNESVAEAARLMFRERVSCLPVVGQSGLLMGILTTRDIVSWVGGLSVAKPEPLGQAV